MKKIILTLLMGVMFLMVSAQTEPVTITGDTTLMTKVGPLSIKVQAPDTGKVTVTKFYNDVKGAIESLSASLKVGATHVYEVLVKQQKIQSIVILSVVSLLLVLALISFKIFRSQFNKEAKIWNAAHDHRKYSIQDDHPHVYIPLIFVVVFTLFCALHLLMNMTDIVTGFYNPEYGAIKSITDMIK